MKEGTTTVIINKLGSYNVIDKVLGIVFFNYKYI